jgi:undecaprenyl-diphosphatase
MARGVGHSILWRVALAAVLRADDALVCALNSSARRSPLGAFMVGRLAAWLAAVEVVLMLALALAGRRDSAVRMLVAVGLVYLLSDALGAIWPRQRPFGRLPQIEALTPHSAERSFPSRHVASALAMAALGGRAHHRLGMAMASVGWVLGVSRVAAGLHYPSDLVGGALLGAAVGRMGGALLGCRGGPNRWALLGAAVGRIGRLSQPVGPDRRPRS